MRTATAAAAVFGLGTLVVGCSVEAPELDVEGLRTGYLYNLELEGALDRARVRLVHACMETRGWTEHVYHHQPIFDEYNGFATFNPRPVLEDAREVGYSRSYAFANDLDLVNEVPQWELAQTQAYWDDLGGEGYGALVFNLDPELASEEEPDAQAMFEREYPEGGCLGEVVEALFGSHDELKDYLGMSYAAIGHEPIAESMRDERVIEVEREWSECMADAGYAFQSPVDADVHARTMRIGSADDGRLYNTEVSDEESEQAYADARCNLEVGLDEKRFATLWEYMDAFVAEHETDYYAYREVTADLIERASELLAEGRW